VFSSVVHQPLEGDVTLWPFVLRGRGDDSPPHNETTLQTNVYLFQTLSNHQNTAVNATRVERLTDATLIYHSVDALSNVKCQVIVLNGKCVT